MVRITLMCTEMSCHGFLEDKTLKEYMKYIHFFVHTACFDNYISFMLFLKKVSPQNYEVNEKQASWEDEKQIFRKKILRCCGKTFSTDRIHKLI